MKSQSSTLLTLFLIMINMFVFGQTQKCYTDGFLQSLQQTDPAKFEKMRAAQTDLLLTNAKITDDIYMIPVVVHVVYKTESQNISDIEIFEQINVLNEDFRRLNPDTINTLPGFQGVAADCRIEFCLAQFDPEGNPTSGIIRTHTDTTEWLLGFSEKVKFTNQGGDDGWPAISYLNIWVCNLQDGILGYAYGPPSGAPEDGDGIVVDYKNFGLGDVSSKPYDLGRTTTHEIGHWLGLNHVWSGFGSCGAMDDGIEDTPPQSGETYGCPEGEVYDICSPESPGIMYQNYLDYTDDACMNLFTEGQKNKMRSVIETKRASLLFSSAGCNEIPPLPGDIAELIIYPVPTSGEFTIVIKNFLALQENMEINIYDALGQLVSTANPTSANTVAQYFNLSHLATGCYFVRVFNGTYFLTDQFLLY
jgi:hypothetical protein